MPMCGFNPKMLKGLTMFAQGLYEQAEWQAERQGISLGEAFEKEVKEMNVFLAALDEHYEVLRKSTDVDDAMRQLVAWADARKRA